MERRDALKSLALLAGSVGMTVTPITAHDADDITMITLQTDKILSAKECDLIKAEWELASVGTKLEGVRTVVFSSGLKMEVVRMHGPQLNLSELKHG